MDSIPQTLIDGLAERYELRGVVGRGGMATVYWAVDTKLDREVAIKVLRDELAANLGTERFLREIAIAAQLQHPHILLLIDSGQVGDTLYYVMPLVDGGSLRKRMEAGPLPLDETVAIVDRVAGALSHAHEQGVVHRDIKPENILFSRGHAVVADFGIAKAVSTAAGGLLTQTGFAVGTVGYMSPEQAAGSAALGPPSDVYGLACVTYEMLVGSVPGVWLSDADSGAGHIANVPDSHRDVLDGLPRHVEPALAAALALRPNHRLASPVAFLAALRGDPVLPAYRAPATNRPPPTVAQPQPDSAPVVRTDQPSPPFPRGLFTVPSRVAVDTTIAGEVPPDGFGTLLLEIQAELGDVGRTQHVGDVWSWNNANWEGGGVHVTVRPGGGETRMLVSEATAPLKVVTMLASTVAGGVAAVFLVSVGHETGMFVANFRLLAGAMAVIIPSTVVAGQSILRAHLRTRRKRLGELLRKLVGVSRKAVGERTAQDR